MAAPSLYVCLIAASLLCACGARNTGAADARAAAVAAANATPPSLTSADVAPEGHIDLVGRAAPNSRVRLATPQGQAQFAAADDNGAWRVILPASTQLRLFGLSMQDADGKRTVQSEGYLAVSPEGDAAQLRSGAGAVVAMRGSTGVRILAVDFDRQGGAVISGQASPGVSIITRVDGVQRGQGPSDAQGRFSMALSEPLARGSHDIEVADGGNRARAAALVSPAAALTQAPFRAERSPTGWRIDWMTPGGGVQSTLMITTSEPST